jgi:hypothetical protein
MTQRTGSVRPVRVLMLSLAGLGLAACTSGSSHRSSGLPSGSAGTVRTAAPTTARPFNPASLVGLTVAEATRLTPKEVCVATNSVDGRSLGASILPCRHGHVMLDVHNGLITQARTIKY